jgi:hypothetical protein
LRRSAMLLTHDTLVRAVRALATVYLLFSAARLS